MYYIYMCMHIYVKCICNIYVCAYIYAYWLVKELQRFVTQYMELHADQTIVVSLWFMQPLKLGLWGENKVMKKIIKPPLHQCSSETRSTGRSQGHRAKKTSHLDMKGERRQACFELRKFTQGSPSLLLSCALQTNATSEESWMSR